MKIARMGIDFVTVTEDNIDSVVSSKDYKIHLIKMAFYSPNERKIFDVLDKFPSTNRFVIEDNIRIYNNALKRSNKKFYVQNKENTGFISFFRKNNKVLLDITRLSEFEKQFVLGICFEDILSNIEVMMMERNQFEEKREILSNWRGNVVMYNPDYIV